MTYAPAASLSDTAFLAAYYRAQETDRPDAIIGDPFARILGGNRGESNAVGIPCATAGFGCAVRTWLIDELITERVQSGSVDAIISLGAGLDARPYRLPLPRTLKWIEVDEHAMLTYKRDCLSQMQANCQLSQIDDFVTVDWSLDRIMNELDPGERCLVLTEGLLIYLDELTVRHLAFELHSSLNVAGWIVDFASPLALQLMDQVELSTSNQDRPEWKFAPVDGVKFFESLNWRVASISSCVDTGHRLQRELVPQSILLNLPEAQQRMLRQLSHVALMVPARETVSRTSCVRQGQDCQPVSLT